MNRIMRVNTFAALALLALGVPSCAKPRGEMVHAGSAPAQETRLEGVLRNTGTAPIGREVALRDDEGKSTTLAGPLTAELTRLAGARVALWGRVAERGHVAVSRYEILSIDGAPVRVGTVQHVAGDTVELRTEAGELLRLPGLALLGTPFRAGQKVWVQGAEERVGGALQLKVHKYGVLTP
jgi:hypothetical protein